MLLLPKLGLLECYLNKHSPSICLELIQRITVKESDIVCTMAKKQNYYHGSGKGTLPSYIRQKQTRREASAAVSAHVFCSEQTMG